MNNKEILALAVPSIIANITTPLLGLVDTAITGHLGSEAYIAAIAVGSSMFNLLYWLFGFLRMGSSGLTAIATGRADRRQQALILYRGLLIALLAAAIILASSRFIVEGLLKFLDPGHEAAVLARQYFAIVVWGSPAVLSTYVFTGWFLGMQSGQRPMVISILINVVNIAVSPVLAFGFDMKMEGIAIGTLVAQWAGALIGLLMCVKYHLPKASLQEILDRQSLIHYFKVNSDIVLRTACLIAVTLWFTREGAKQGDLILAANALLMQFFLMFSYMIDGFAFAAEALIGKYTGQGHRTRLNRCIKILFKWGASLALAYSVIYFVAGEWILSVLTDDAGVRQCAGEYIMWAVTVPLAGFTAFIWDGVYIGSTATRGMLLSMILSTTLFFGLYFLLRHTLGNHALWLAFLSYLLSRGLIQSLLWNKLFFHYK